MPYQDGIKKPGARLTSLFADISSAKVEWRPFAASLGSMPNGRPRQTLRLPFLAGTALPGKGDVMSVAGGHWAWSQARRSEEHTSELQSHSDLVCRLLLEKKKKYDS